MKCLAKDRNNNPCRCRIVDETRFCKLHQYMNEYTDTMLEQTKLCSGCLKMHYMENSEYLSCEQCRSREKPKRVDVVLCKSENCKFKRSVENIYCGKHQICLFVDETKSVGKKVCANYVRRCRSQLDSEYKYTRCETCLEKDREKDRIRRGKSVECITENSNIRKCSMCNKTQEISQFIGMKDTVTKHCLSCREKGKIRDLCRNKELRNAKAIIAESKPERKQKKKEWAENVKYKSKKYHYNCYKTHAQERELCFDIAIDVYMELISLNCYYCNSINDVGFNGVDRKNNTIGYTKENSVPCCSICNFMKKVTDSETFIKKAIHIHEYTTKRVKLYPELFIDHKNVHYSVYNKRSLKKYNIGIDEKIFDNIVSQCCYLCGKENTEIHKNGIDRVDNTIGYTEDNCRPCCGDCNMMKRDYSYDIVISQCEKIMVNNKIT